MNTALHVSPPTESTHRAPSERTLSISFPRQEELRRLPLAERMALRIALHLIVRAGSADRHAALAARAARSERSARVLAEYEAQRFRPSVSRPIL